MTSPLTRILCESVQKSLDSFLDNTRSLNNLSPDDWMRFYNFVVVSYKNESRPSVSQLCDILTDKGMRRPGNLSVLYAHSLYVLAIKDELKIYGEGFNP